jgi:hypothetical protein
MKITFLLAVVLTCLFTSCGPSACDCAKLKEKNSILIYATGATSEMKKTRKQIEKCAEKFDGLDNAVKQCNENPD